MVPRGWRAFVVRSLLALPLFPAADTDDYYNQAGDVEADLSGASGSVDDVCEAKARSAAAVRPEPNGKCPPYTVSLPSSTCLPSWSHKQKLACKPAADAALQQLSAVPKELLQPLRDAVAALVEEVWSQEAICCGDAGIIALRRSKPSGDGFVELPAMRHFGHLLLPIMEHVAAAYAYPHTHYPSVQLVRAGSASQLSLGTTDEQRNSVHEVAIPLDGSSDERFLAGWAYEVHGQHLNAAPGFAGLMFHVSPRIGGDAMEKLERLNERTGSSYFASAEEEQWLVVKRSAALARLQRMKPIHWVHTPKTATSFGNTLFVDACPSGAFGGQRPVLGVGQRVLLDLMMDYPLEKECPGGFSARYQSPPGHVGMGGFWSEGSGRTVVLLRQPEQRLVSAWNHGRHSARDAASPSDYRDRVEGCQVKMLVRKGGHPRKPMTGPCGHLPKPTKAEVNEAIDRLQNDVAFVGIVEEWALTVCLWHAKFGGECREDEFINTRPGAKTAQMLQQGEAKSNRQVATYDTSDVLGDWKDEADRALYEAGRLRFLRDLQTYDATPASCRSKICPGAADRFPVDADGSEFLAGLNGGAEL
eukprot:TRINITY_DN63629_c0_g1_i1.p1 TRINITY_DN63629_c0_g1~~TRINITY_DN63629_c0_g1_i1.p1  ORF type:complete len:587 (-),score=116.83 TRINITY_DN63629_c0_g1_i1:63-1823(-)